MYSLSQLFNVCFRLILTAQEPCTVPPYKQQRGVNLSRKGVNWLELMATYCYRGKCPVCVSIKPPYTEIARLLEISRVEKNLRHAV